MDALQIKLFFNYPISFTKDELTWTLKFFYWYLFNLLEDSLEKKRYILVVVDIDQNIKN